MTGDTRKNKSPGAPKESQDLDRRQRGDEVEMDKDVPTETDPLLETLGGYYDELLNEPMPDKIAELLKKLEDRELKK